MNGDYNLYKFINTLDYSLDLIKLREVYKKVYGKDDFSFTKNKKEYSPRVINVTFKYSNKEFNKLKTNTYVKSGCMVADSDFEDCVCIRDGELVGIKTDELVTTPVSNEILDRYFYFDDGVYKARKNIPTLNSVADIRNELYTKGFICDGIRYVRFKRSSGSSRVGKCLFIDEKLYYRMHKWEMCGIKVKDGDAVDLASLEPYIALTLSSIIDTIQLYPENILVVDDYESIFTDHVVATRLADGRLVTKPETVEITNKIWDGQSLMDRSVFLDFLEQQKSRGIPNPIEHGMLLLRARFFKSCCFNTNIQKWFFDNGITDVSQLNGYTQAKKIEDIKLITTPSSIKYLKFGTMEKWFSTLEPTFGVVKHEKKTHFFDGRMVQTHYQLLNTLQMTPEEVDKFVQPSLQYAEMIKKDIAVLRHQIGYQYQTPDEDYYTKSVTSKNDIIYKLLNINDRFQETKMYCQFCNDLITSFIKNLRCGHILVNGNYSTLCGNPIEMLKQSIGSFDGSSIIAPNTVYSRKFDDCIDILGSRSPHVTMGNILITKNVRYETITEYMNPTEEIVYVNSINDNLLERLSGADFDSDTMLLTDNPILIQAAKRNYNNFPVPTKFVESTKVNRRYTSEQQSDLDIKTSVNKIGEIINLSQELNSLLWERLNNGETIDDVMELYCDIAQLDVMSNLEIDSAKRENPANNTYELQCLKRKYDRRDNMDRHIRPLFFKYIDGYKGYRSDYHIYVKTDDDFSKRLIFDKYKDAIKYKNKSNEDIYIERGRMTYRKYATTMDYLQKSINKFSMPRHKDLKPLSYILPNEIDFDEFDPNTEKELIDLIRVAKSQINAVWNDGEYTPRQKREMTDFIRSDCILNMKGIEINQSTLAHFFKKLETKYSDISRFAFYLLLDRTNYRMKKDIGLLLYNNSLPTEVLVESNDGDVEIFNFKYRKVKNQMLYEDMDDFRKYVVLFLNDYGLRNSWVAEKVGIDIKNFSSFINGKRLLPKNQAKCLYYYIEDYKERF